MTFDRYTLQRAYKPTTICKLEQFKIGVKHVRQKGEGQGTVLRWGGGVKIGRFWSLFHKGQPSTLSSVVILSSKYPPNFKKKLFKLKKKLPHSHVCPSHKLLHSETQVTASLSPSLWYQ